MRTFILFNSNWNEYMHGLVCLVSTLMLIYLEAVRIGCQFYDGTAVAAAIEDCPTNTPKQVHSYGPIVSQDQLMDYFN